MSVVWYMMRLTYTSRYNLQVVLRVECGVFARYAQDNDGCVYITLSIYLQHDTRRTMFCRSRTLVDDMRRNTHTHTRTYTVRTQQQCASKDHITTSHIGLKLVLLVYI